MPESCAIEAETVSRLYGETPALRGVNLRVDWGERVALLGANGAGKTTLLRIFALLLRPTTGVIRLAGHAPEEGGRELRRLVGYHGHQSALYPDLSVTENLTFFARLYHLPEAHQRIEWLLERLGISERRHDRVSALSRGLQQRAGLARALLHDPPILLLDEPDASLDGAGQDALAAMLAGSARTVVLSTHDPAWGRRVCSRTVTLASGQIAGDQPALPAKSAGGTVTVLPAGVAG